MSNSRNIADSAPVINFLDGATSNIQDQINNINPAPTFTATASGALANGDTVIVNANGTVSAVEQTTVNTPIVGGTTVFESSNLNEVSSTFDTSANKIIISYRDQGNHYPTAVVGTISGTNITFGTPVVLKSAAGSFTSAQYDPDENKTLIAYQNTNGSPYQSGLCRVCTTNGTSLSLGSELTFEAASIEKIDSTYDTSSNKVILAYRSKTGNYGVIQTATISGNSASFGTGKDFEDVDYLNVVYDPNTNKSILIFKNLANNRAQARVTTLSGTTFSLGGLYNISGETVYHVTAAMDTNSNKIVVAYNYDSPSTNGYSKVGTVSGTTTTWGSEVQFNTGETTYADSVFDSNSNKIVLVYRDAGNSYYGTAIVGTVSGTSITWSGKTAFNNYQSDYMSVGFDSNLNQCVISYSRSSTGDGQSTVFAPVSITSNLTTENYIGISNAAYADGAAATVQIVGSVDDSQSSLTAGQQYFVQEDGTLGLAADNTSVVAGTAVSATKLIVKG